MTKSRTVLALASAILIGSIQAAGAAGFEKAVFWDAHYAAVAGAAQSSVQGPQSLYWNPAGLGGIQCVQINGDFSPTISKFSGPMTLNNNTVQDSNTGFSPIGAAFIGYGVTPQWGAAIGYYVSSGLKADYDSVTPGTLAGLGITYAPPLRADLSVTQLSVGTGYELVPGFKVGAAYEVTFINATLDTANTAGAGAATVLVSTQINNISKTNWSGFRVGFEWAPKDSPFGFGATYRNQIRFAAPGSANVTTAAVATPAGTSGGTNEPVLVSAVLPQRLDAAAHYVFDPSFTGFLGYSFTNYSREKDIGVSGVSVPALGGLLPDSSTGVPLNWTNMHNVRIAGEYSGMADWPIRAGFVWTSEVTPKGNALPILSAPGNGYTLIAGTGHKLMPSLTADAAFEYSWDSGSVAAADGPAATTGIGDYSAKAYALHLSATYAF